MIINLFFCLQLWYETCIDIPAGSELMLVKEPLNLKDMFADSMSADERSDRETGNYNKVFSYLVDNK